jgi:4'-phosphopantetheinyl transferase
MMLHDPDWRSPPFPEPDTSAASVQIWRLRLDDAPFEALRPLTVPAEHDRACQFQFEADQHRHLAGRGLARATLASRIGCAPRELSIVEDPNGKPRLDGEFGKDSALEFNVAHAADTAVVALSRERPVGIDVEPQDRADAPEDLARRVLTDAERRRWRALPATDRAAVFIHLWTCKEAFLKATGTGLRRAPDTIECSVEDKTAVALTDADAGYSPDVSASEWALHPFRVSEDLVGAVVRRHRLPSPLLFADAPQLIDRFSSS